MIGFDSEWESILEEALVLVLGSGLMVVPHTDDMLWDALSGSEDFLCAVSYYVHCTSCCTSCMVMYWGSLRGEFVVVLWRSLGLANVCEQWRT